MTEAFIQPNVTGLAAALLHSLWQGALIASVTAVALAMCRANPNVRYVIASFGLAVLTLCWGITAITHVPQGPTSHTVTDVASVVRSPAPTAPVNESPATSPPSRRLRALPAVEQVLPWFVLLAVPACLLGVVTLTARLAYGCMVVRRLRRTASEASNFSIADLSARLGIGRPVRVAQSAAVHVPILIGWLRPVI